MFETVKLKTEQGFAAVVREISQPEIFGRLLLNECTMTLYESADLSERSVIADELRMRNCVAVEKHDVIRFRLRNGFVQNFGTAKPVVFLVNVKASAPGILFSPPIEHIGSGIVGVI